MTVHSEFWTARAPAKINLALHVTGRRPDGYHTIETLAVFTDFGDGLTVEPHFRDDFAVTGPFAADVPCDENNLVVRARDALRRAFPDHTERSVRITLNKNLPVSSGIGGGSSDAAAALKTLSRFWDLEAGSGKLHEIALALGADVPMCLAASPLVARGIGEETRTLHDFPALPLVLVNPGVTVATKSVFQDLRKRDHDALPPLRATANLAELLAWLRLTRNDLETPAVTLAPEILVARHALEANGAAFARMSGSGATCFGIFGSPDKAEAAAGSIAAAEKGWFVAAASSGAS